VSNPTFIVESAGSQTGFSAATTPLAEVKVNVPFQGTFGLLVSTTGAAALQNDVDVDDAIGATLILGACYNTDASLYCDPDTQATRWQVRVVATTKQVVDDAGTRPVSYSWSGNWILNGINPSTGSTATVYTVRLYYKSSFHTTGDQPEGVAKWKILDTPQAFLNVVLLQLS